MTLVAKPMRFMTWVALLPIVGLLCGFWRGSGVVTIIPPATTTFDPANLGSEFNLSGGNLVATLTATGDFSFSVARSVASHSTGKYYAEFIPTGGSWTDNFSGSLCVTNAASSLNFKLGNDANSCAYYNAYGVIQINNTNAVTGLSTYVSGNVVGMAVDLGAKLIWFRINGGNWNNNGTANPTTGAGGGSLAAMTGVGPYYAAVVSFNDAVNVIWTANFGATSYANAAPSGFGNW